MSNKKQGKSPSASTPTTTVVSKQKDDDKKEVETPLTKLYALITKAVQFTIAVILIGFLVNLLLLKIQRQNIELESNSRKVWKIETSDGKRNFDIATYCFSNSSNTDSTVFIEGSVSAFHQSMEKMGKFITQTEKSVRFCSYDRPGVGLFSSPLNDTSFVGDIEAFYAKFFADQAQQSVIVIAHGFGANLFNNILYTSKNSAWKAAIKRVISIDPVLTTAQIDEITLHNTINQFLALSGFRRALGKIIFSINFFANGQFQSTSLFKGPYDYLKAKNPEIQLERQVILNDQKIYDQGNHNLKRLRDNNYLKPVSVVKATNFPPSELLLSKNVTDGIWWKVESTTDIDSRNSTLLFNSIADVVKSALRK